MANTTSPLSFEIDAVLAQRLEDLRAKLGHCPISTVVDYALEQFNFESIQLPRGGERRQLSVRLDDGKRTQLDKLSRAEKVSMAYLIRLALESLIEETSKKTALSKVQKDVASTAAAAPRKAAKKAGAKKAAKKAGAKKAVAKKATKKAAAKKTAKKATKKVAKKAVKKAAKKAGAKKAVAKKATKKAAKKAGKKAARKK